MSNDLRKQLKIEKKKFISAQVKNMTNNIHLGEQLPALAYLTVNSYNLQKRRYRD